MHVLTELKIEIGPVLIDAAVDHYRVCGSPIQYFILPAWMYIKLTREPGFIHSEISCMGRYKGITTFKADAAKRPLMRERGCNFNYEVITDGE